MHYGWTAPAAERLLREDSPIKTTHKQAEWLEQILMLGACLGLPITILLADRIGRKGSLLVASALALSSWFLIGIASKIEMIFVARFLSGIAGDMAFVSAPMYIAEIADQKIRGFLSSVIYLMMLSGIIITYCVVPFTPLYVPCLIGGTFVLLELIIFPFMPESPYYLLYRNREEDAKNALKRLRENEDVDKEFEEIRDAMIRERAVKGRPQDIILVSSNRKALMIMSVLNAAQHFSSISVMLMNLHSILAAAGSVYIAHSTAAIMFSFMMLISAVTASLFIDKFGRKALIINSSILTGLCLFTIATYFYLKNTGMNVDAISWIPVVTVMAYAICFKSGLGMVPIVLTAELFPTNVKALGMTLADINYIIWAIVSLSIYQWLENTFGMHVPFYLFACSCFITAIFTYFFIPETKGKTLDEIQYILKGETPPPRSSATQAEKEQFIEK